jgi:hypothetical protein
MALFLARAAFCSAKCKSGAGNAEDGGGLLLMQENYLAPKPGLWHT